MTEFVPIHGLDVVASRQRFRSEMTALLQQLSTAQQSLSSVVGDVQRPSVTLPDGDPSDPAFVTALTGDAESRRLAFLRQRDHLAGLKQELQAEIQNAEVRRRNLLTKAFIAAAVLLAIAGAWLAL